MSKYTRWKTIFLKWKKKYGVPEEAQKRYNPANVRIEDKTCRNCGSKTKISRHHKGHEYAFALVLEDIYAPRYIQFHPDDVIPLCSTCHKKIHKLYQGILLELKLYLADYVGGYDKYGYPIWRSRPDYAVLESYRKRLVARCDRWIAGNVRRPTRATKKEY